jgi:hypothetical protein
LAEEPVEGGALGVGVPVDCELDGGEDRGVVVAELVGLPEVEAVAEVDDVVDGVAGDLG